MGGKTPKTPQVVTRDPVAEQRAADSEATRKTNAELADRRRRRAGSSLLTAGPRGSGPAKNSLLAQAVPGLPAAMGDT